MRGGLALGVAAPALGDVAKDEHRADDTVVEVADGRGAVVDGALRPVGGDQDRMIREADDRALLEHASDGVGDRIAALLVDDAEDLVAAASARVGEPAA